MGGPALIDERLPQIEELCRRYGVTRLRLFGSAVRDDWNEATSDFDFLAEFGPPPEGVNLFDQQFGFTVELERLLERPVDVVDWNMAKKPLFRQTAEAKAKVVYAT